VGPLARKALRDFRSSRAQALGLAGLAFVVVVAVAGGDRARGTLVLTRDAFYARLAAADLEVRFSPSPPGVLGRFALPEGVAEAEERTLARGLVRAGTLRPIPALVRVLPASGPPRIDRVELLRGGRYPGPDEAAAVLDRSSRDLHGLGPGSVVTVTVGETTKRLPVVGVSYSPEHLLYPAHPEYVLPLRGTVAVVGVSEAATKDVEGAGRVNSLLFRFAPGADRARIQAELLERLPVAVSEVIPAHEEPGRLFTNMLIANFDIYMPAITTIFAAIGLLLLVLTVSRMVARQRTQIGTLLALGHGPVAVAFSFLGTPIAATAAGILVGALVHGTLARTIAGAYGTSIGFPPLEDPGPGSMLVLVGAGCLLAAGLAGLVPGLRIALQRPARALRPAEWDVTRAAKGRLGRSVRSLFSGIRPPLPVVLGLVAAARRGRETACAALGLGLAFAVILGFLIVHVTHRQEIHEAVVRSSRDATVYFREPVTPEGVAEAGRRAGGAAEGFASRVALAALASGLEFRRVVGVEPRGWVEGQPLARGRLLGDRDAAEIVVDHWVVDRDGLDVGSTVTLYPGGNAPEGETAVVVGVLDGVSLGRILAPIGFVRRLYGLGDRSTGAFVDSVDDADAIEAALFAWPEVESVYSTRRAEVQVDATFQGSLFVLEIALGLAIFVGILFLGVLASLDAADGAYQVAVLLALGWRTRALVALGLTQVLVRGVLAILTAGLLGPALARWFMARITAANHYRMDVLVPWWLPLLVLGSALLLLPLGALPALRAGTRLPPARALRLLMRE
jgi:putative ABC transport system permease protein